MELILELKLVNTSISTMPPLGFQKHFKYKTIKVIQNKYRKIQKINK